MSKSYCSLGLMSGTSADGVDASIIQSDGDIEYEVILDKYFKYSQNIYKNIYDGILKYILSDDKKNIELIKEQIVSDEKEKKLKMFSNLHFSNLERSIRVNFL